MRRLAGLGMLALLALPADGASAPSSASRHLTVSLRLEKQPSARGCPSEAELRREVSGILGYSPFVQKPRASLICVLWAEGETRRARLQLRDRRTRKLLGQRDLSASGPGCDALASAVALAIALAVDPLARPPPKPAAVGAAPGDAAPPDTVSPGASQPAPSVALSSLASRPPVRASSPATVSRVPGGKGTLAAAPPALAAPESGVFLPDRAFSALVDAGALQAQTLDASDAGGLPLAVVATLDGGPTVTASVDAGAYPPVSATSPDAGSPLALALVAGSAPDAGSIESAAEAPSPDRAAAPTVAEATGEARPWHLFAGAEGNVALGVLPSTAPGVALFLGMAWKPASVELEVRWLPSTSIAFQGGSISSSLVSVGLTGCALFGPWGACGTAQAGPFSSSGSGFGQSIEASTWVASLGARAQWTWVFANPVGLRLHVDGLVNLIRPRLLVNTAQAWEAPALAAVVGAGLYVRF